MYMDRILADAAPALGLLAVAHHWFALQKASERRHASVVSTRDHLTRIGERQGSRIGRNRGERLDGANR